MSSRHAVRSVAILGLLIALATAVGAGEVRVAQKDKNFSVREVAVRVNEPLLFVNEDSVTHNVYSLSKGMEFEIRTQQPGQSDTIRFAREGEAEVLCAIHPKMKLRVTVKP
ncbi:MAG TPA: plastocyanin/azurin family copper-binding protein [Methylomirabilota bacterium]